MDLKADDPQLIFDGDPLYRLAIDRSQRQADDFNQGVGQAIEHLQEAFQLMRGMRCNLAICAKFPLPDMR